MKGHYAFITYHAHADAQKAIDKMHDREFQGAKLIVEKSGKK